MTELAGGELCLPQRPHNQVGAARRRRRSHDGITHLVVLSRPPLTSSFCPLAASRCTCAPRPSRSVAPSAGSAPPSHALNIGETTVNNKEGKYTMISNCFI